MALSQTPIIPADGVITLADNAALTLTVQYEDGDLQISGLRKGQMQVQTFKDRGITYSARNTEDQEISFQFSAHLIGLTDGAAATLLDAVRRAGAWAAAASTLPVVAGGFDVYCLKITWASERSNYGGTADTSCVMKYCTVEADLSEGIPSKISIKGTLIPYSTDYLTIT